ncbi:MAG TPA: C4-type zinc ribbon domain-containing protein [Armatimonadota bacterium]
MALDDELVKLLDVQQIDSQIYQREQKLKALDSGESLKQNAIKILQQHDAAVTKRQQLEAEQRDKELALKTVEQKRDTVHEKLYSGRVNNPKELGDLQADEEMLNAQISDLEGPLLDLMDQAEQARNAETLLAESLSSAKRAWKDTVARTQAETKRLQQEIADLRPERQRLAALVDPMLLRRYDDIRSRREGLGLVATGNDTCPGCHIKLTARVLESMRANEELTQCENCSRILLWKS